jgi:hypothetical protein
MTLAGRRCMVRSTRSDYRPDVTAAVELWQLGGTSPPGGREAKQIASYVRGA